MVKSFCSKPPALVGETTQEKRAKGLALQMLSSCLFEGQTHVRRSALSPQHVPFLPWMTFCLHVRESFVPQLPHCDCSNLGQNLHEDSETVCEI